MPLTLPEPDPTLLPGSPLDLVVCQLRFEDKPQLTTPETGLAFHQALGGSDGPYPRFDQLRGQTLNVELGLQAGAPVITQNEANGWRLQAADGSWIVAVMAGQVSLESKNYPGWDGFSTRLTAVLEALAELAAPALEQRIGLRYVDRIREVDAHSAADWTEYLQPHVLGFAAHEVLGAHVANARQQLLLDLGDGFGCVITHGFLPSEDGSLDYLLDYDVYREGGRAFSLDSVRETMDVLHSDARKLFDASITANLREVFQQR